jgi:hypothetical protein
MSDERGAGGNQLLATNELVEFQDFKKITHRFREIHRTYLKSTKKNNFYTLGLANTKIFEKSPWTLGMSCHVT